MRRCIPLRPSSVLPVYDHKLLFASSPRRTYRSYSTARPSDHHDARNTTAAATPAEEEPFRINQENKTIETAVGDLPLSPIMDPSFWEATRRHQVPKAKPGKPKNSVERQLRANPFAKALATPVRICALTRTRLPKFFLQDFNLVAHPETGEPWWISHRLTNEQSPTAEDPDATDLPGSLPVIESDDTLKTPGETETNLEPEKNEVVGNNFSKPQFEGTSSRGPAGYTLARRDLLQSLATRKSGFERGYRALGSVSSSTRHKIAVSKAVWREDMDNFILGLMREHIVRDLLYLSKLCVENQRYYIVKCHGWDDIQFKHKGAVLWLGEEGQASEFDTSQNQPGPFATFDIKSEAATASVAVHNMIMLLGVEQAGKVRREADALKDGAIFMLAGRRTVDLQMKLWKLQGYLADYREDS
ncbi:hypothetical protein F4778DRAFT_25105 [Xylariomycetidae sp. FL2044]|nr:hypothetical protein F4778DRAFT_25105 [Xylariomycetidae sp. FL2044]